jgi:hypothetical protein
MTEVLQLLEERPELRKLNEGIRRNEGFERSLAVDRQTIASTQRSTTP